MRARADPFFILNGGGNIKNSRRAFTFRWLVICNFLPRGGPHLALSLSSTKGCVGPSRNDCIKVSYRNGVQLRSSSSRSCVCAVARW